VRSLIQRVLRRLGRDPGLAYLAVGLVLAVVLYAPTLGRGLVNYDDPWLYQDNALVRRPSLANVRTVLTDLELPNRFTLGAEYLPVRDLSVMTDVAVWGEHYGGFHATNVAIYLAAIAFWFLALVAFGVPREVAGLALVIWAVHPVHVESVAWLAERKGVLGAMWSGACALGYARFRANGRARWLVLAVVTSVAAVWSKAIAAFAVAALAAIELVLRRSGAAVPLRRSARGLATIALFAGLAYVPVVLVATRLGVVGTGAAWSRPVAVLGAHGFYLRLVAGLVANAVSYPIASAGPSMFDIALGALGFIALALAFLPRWTSRPWALPLRIAAVLWLFGWLPVGHLVLPIQQVFVADRYMLFSSLGFALVLAVGIAQLGRLRTLVIVVVVVALSARAFVAQDHWASNTRLWQRAATSNPADANAWAMYVESLDSEGRTGEAMRVAEAALAHARSPRLVMHAALAALAAGHLVEGLRLMTEAATGGEPRAAANLANLLADFGELRDALLWARLAAVTAPSYANGHRIHGKIARLIDRYSPEALDAFSRAYQLEPESAANRYNLGISLGDAGRKAEARMLLQSCLADPGMAQSARLALDHL
jgi:tetratricopeptide (TPR) repeat protein